MTREELASAILDAWERDEVGITEDEIGLANTAASVALAALGATGRRVVVAEGTLCLSGRFAFIEWGRGSSLHFDNTTGMTLLDTHRVRVVVEDLEEGGDGTVQSQG